MKIPFNAYNEANKPRVFLALPNRKFIVGTDLNAKDLDTTFRYKGGISFMSFKIYKYSGIEENDGYNEISIGKYIWLEDLGWYRITDINEKNDGENPYKEVKCSDLTNELKYTMLTSFGSMGTDADEQGGLDRYALYNADDQSHSIAHIFMAKNPGWTFKYIDPDISTNHRSFDVDSISSYEFLTGNVAEAFDCAFEFDSNDRTVSAYKIENIGKKSRISLSFRNLIKEMGISWNDEDIRTVLHVSGGNDATGTALSIAGVNPGGNDSISNFSFFYDSMSAELKAKLEEYYQQMEDADGLITTALSQLKVLQDELAILNSHDPAVQSSTDWSEYGLTQLKAKSDEYLVNMSAASDGNMSDPDIKYQYDNYSDLHTAVENEIAKRKSQITAKEAEVDAKKAEASSYVVDIHEVMGDDLYEELLPFVREDTLCDDSFIATDSMTNNEILEMKQALYNHGFEELNRACYPQFDMTVNSVNFPVLKKYQEEVSQLELGDILEIQLADDVFVEARLLEMELNWEDYTKFNLTFSSKSSLTNGYFFFADMKKIIDSTSSTIKHRKSGYNGITKQANAAYNVSMQEFLDLSMKQIQSNANNIETEFNSAGLLFKKYLPDEGKYAPEKMWITNRQLMLFEEPDGTNLKTPKVAIGKVYMERDGEIIEKYGVAAPAIYGDFMFSKYLTVQNENNTITMNQNGIKAVATNGFGLQINPDDPNNIFTISENTNKLMYIDAVNRKLVFRGRGEFDEGLIGGWTVATNKLFSGGVGMSSDTASGAIAFWAGNVTPTSAPFRVTNNGMLEASNVNITGGSLNIGSNFNVNSFGVLTAKSVNITNGYINMGNGLFTASGAGVNFGDYFVSADGTGTLMSVNGLVNITDVITSGPSGELARLTIGSDLMYDAVEIRGTGDVNTARVTCRQDCYFEDNWTAGMGALSMFKQIYNRLDAIRYSIQNMGGNVDWD